MSQNSYVIVVKVGSHSKYSAGFHSLHPNYKAILEYQTPIELKSYVQTPNRISKGERLDLAHSGHERDRIYVAQPYDPDALHDPQVDRLNRGVATQPPSHFIVTGVEDPAFESEWQRVETEPIFASTIEEACDIALALVYKYDFWLDPM